MAAPEILKNPVAGVHLSAFLDEVGSRMLRGYRLIVIDVKLGELAVTHFGVKRLIDNRVLKGHLVGAHRLTADAGGIAKPMELLASTCTLRKWMFVESATRTA